MQLRWRRIVIKLLTRLVPKMPSRPQVPTTAPPQKEVKEIAYNPWNDFNQQLKGSGISKEERRQMYYEWKEHHGILTKKDKKATVGRKAWENGSAGSSGAWPIPSPRALRRLTPWVQKETSTGASRTQPGYTSEAEMEVDEQWQHVRPPSSSTSAAANVTTKSVPVESDPDLDAGEENVGCKLTQGIPPPPGRKLK